MKENVFNILPLYPFHSLQSLYYLRMVLGEIADILLRIDSSYRVLASKKLATVIPSPVVYNTTTVWYIQGIYCRCMCVTCSDHKHRRIMYVDTTKRDTSIWSKRLHNTRSKVAATGRNIVWDIPKVCTYAAKHVPKHQACRTREYGSRLLRLLIERAIGVPQFRTRRNSPVGSPAGLCKPMFGPSCVRFFLSVAAIKVICQLGIPVTIITLSTSDIAFFHKIPLHGWQKYWYHWNNDLDTCQQLHCEFHTHSVLGSGTYI